MTLHRITRITALGLTLCAGTAMAVADDKADSSERSEARTTATTSGSTTRDLNSGAILQRLVISTPDGGRLIRWVPQPSPRSRSFNSGGVRVSIPSDSWGLPPANGGLPGRDLVGGAASDEEMNERLIMPETQTTPVLPGVLRPRIGLQPTRPNKPAAPLDAPTETIPAAPILQPGPGFAGPADAPQRVGSPGEEGYTAQAIARWNVVPFQEITEGFEFGVVAFHKDGIDRVEFSLDGGDWIRVDEMTLNERTDTWEYSVQLDPSLVERDGLVEIRARVTPTVGEQRLLAGPIVGERQRNTGEYSMFLTVNDGGTLPRPERWVDARNGSDVSGDGTREKPFQSISAALSHIQSDESIPGTERCDGAVIHCEPGHYIWGPQASPGARTLERWLTIRPAEGVSRDQVVFDESTSSGFRTTLIKLEDVTVQGHTKLSTSRPASRFKKLWLEGVSMEGPGRTEPVAAVFGPWWDGIYVTDTEIRSYKDAVKFGTLVRNTHAYDLGSDAYGMTGLVVNSSVTGIDGTGTTFHPDVYQIQPNFDGTRYAENLIVFNFKAFDLYAQGIFSRGNETVEDVAFVNVLMESDPPENPTNGSMASQWMADSTNHLLLWNVSLPGYKFNWRTDYLANVSARACVFEQMIVNSEYTDVVRPEWFEDNHYIDIETFGAVALGSGSTIGDPGFLAPQANDFRPSLTSVLVGRQDEPLVPVDAGNQRRDADLSVGALIPED